MNLRFVIGLCAVVVGLSGLTLCQPPRPRIASVEAPAFATANHATTKDILAAPIHAERGGVALNGQLAGAADRSVEYQGRAVSILTLV